jgi:pre-mRNA cleavage complex 2 protein Pcf11
VPPEHKLPAFYLLDSIVKNCPDPYIGLVTPIIHRLFLDIYNSVDETTRTKMREMLVTWRTGLAGGGPVFPNAVLDMIERGVYDRGYVSAPHRASRRALREPQSFQRNNGPRKPTPQQVWTELEVVFSTKERMARENPHDEVTRKHLEILIQVCSFIVQRSAWTDGMGMSL